MQSYSPDGVRRERTAWRDLALSERHRQWGFNCPAVDLDFLMVEYNIGLPVAVVEYKHEKALMPDLRHPTYRAIKMLCDGYRDGSLPFLLAFYWRECWAFKTWPVNDAAAATFKGGEWLTERQYVMKLYRLRELCLDDVVYSRLHDSLPEDVQANRGA